MKPQADPRRNRPSAEQNGSTSAAFAFATEPTELCQHPQPVPPTNGANLDTKLIANSVTPAPTSPHSTTNIPSSGHEDDEVTPAAAGAAADEIDQLENEVIHFMNLSLEEKEKSEMLSGRLASVTQEKEHLERQVDELDQDLGSDEWQDSEILPADTGDAISRLNAKITKLRASAQQHESDLSTLTKDNDQHTKTITQLVYQLSFARDELAQKTQEEERLRKELEHTTKTLKSEEQTNEELLGDIKAIEQECDELRTSNASSGKKLADAEQTADTLSDLVKRKIAELQNVQKAGAAQAEKMRLEIDLKQKEIERLKTEKTTIRARCEGFEPAPKRMKVGWRLVEPDEVVETVSPDEDKDDKIKKLTEELQRHQKRRVRAIAIAIDLSGSAAGSLTEGIKRFYAHLLNELKSSPCQTYIMTVVHGPGNTATVKSQFSDSWATHESVLADQQAIGRQQHVACLRKIKEVAVTTGLVLDLQVVLIGDGDTDGDSPDGSRAVCTDFASSNPTVHIHSAVVRTGSAEESDKYWSNLEQWHTWNYASGTGGNMMVWWQNNPLPDLRDLVL
ncbi:hypothetical protein J7T55_003741 [Diaporthe amygdali]|uniref:uncharacterized protein n=1 Tax=Phomopsis amygdali TaxID=1214568 RepID=UPI0022FE3508|nr:uncharacterized protein J7T55_003741 [Diaporthe amygdali]KAJ0117328.1 hypothetical protein J7T55_003741 [Diaporthe amygdali]